MTKLVEKNVCSKKAQQLVTAVIVVVLVCFQEVRDKLETARC